MIITSLLDNDFYKFSMMQFVLHKFPNTIVKYKFKCRNNVDLTSYRDEIKSEINDLCDLKFSSTELGYLFSIEYLTTDFIDFLEDFKLKRKHIKIYAVNEELYIEITGPWLRTILFEVPILKIVHEVYSRNNFDVNKYYDIGRKKLDEKIKLLKYYVEDIPKETYQGTLHTNESFIKIFKDKKFNLDNTFQFSDFGTRRCFTGEWHREVVQYLIDNLEPHVFTGTSNVMLARELNIPVIGTMAHELIQAGQAFTKIEESQIFMLQKWAEEYRGHLSIALTDTLGKNKFFKDFDYYLAKLYDGVRHDSGDPFVWCMNVIQHYDKLDIDPKTKKVVFSDGLDIPKAIKLAETFEEEINISFGIGTNLTNDVGITPLQNVIKMVECNGYSVAKISDNPSKTMCEDQNYLLYLESVI